MFLQRGNCTCLWWVIYIGLQEISYLDKHYLSTTPNAIIGWKICIPIGNNSGLALPLKELLGSKAWQQGLRNHKNS
jgi:hypothetical protein